LVYKRRRPPIGGDLLQTRVIDEAHQEAREPRTAICVRVCDKAPIQPLLRRAKPPRKAERPLNRPHIASQDEVLLGRITVKIAARRVARPPFVFVPTV
jgi:hypothetical protein